MTREEVREHAQAVSEGKPLKSYVESAKVLAKWVLEQIVPPAVPPLHVPCPGAIDASR
jgi:hypothetical protein